MTMHDFCAASNITSTVKPADRNPSMENMPSGSTHWKVTLKRGRHRLTTPFSMGPALRGEPETVEVLNCLVSDAAGYENSGGDFESWASEYGFDVDSRRAEKAFKAVATATNKLRSFLGDLYGSALYKTESL